MDIDDRGNFTMDKFYRELREKSVPPREVKRHLQSFNVEKDGDDVSVLVRSSKANTRIVIKRKFALALAYALCRATGIKVPRRRTRL